jgi:HEAT repeat protein
MPRRCASPVPTQRELASSLLQRIRETTDVEEIIELTKNPDPNVRKVAIRSICPCKVYDKIDLFWERILEMTGDENVEVRANVLHVLCDGSPEHLEDRIIWAVQQFNKDKDKSIRRRAHKVLGSYYKTGKWNVL